MERRRGLYTLKSVLGIMVLATTFGCSSIQSLAQPTSTPQFVVQGLCNPPTIPSKLFENTDLKLVYRTLTVPIYMGRSIVVRDYTNEVNLSINPEMVKALYNLYSQINLKSDLIKSGGDPRQYTYTPVADGTTIVIADQPISFLKDCHPGSMAFTANSPQETADHEPDVSILSLQRIRALGRGNTIEEKIAFALATEIGQQHDVLRIQTDFAESLNMGFGELVRFIEANRGSSANLYENYVKDVSGFTFVSSVTRRSIPLTVFSERIFTLASQLITDPVIKVQ